jgi:hypothetical protein
MFYALHRLALHSQSPVHPALLVGIMIRISYQ